MQGTLEDEERLVASGRGKWSQPGVPHRGWQCIDIEDLGEPQATCEMCESQRIRYVHRMEHRNYDEVLAVGCICAGNMEGDVAAARTREAAMKSRASKRATKRKRWITREWRVSAKGNPWVQADGYRVTVHPRGGGWTTTVASDDNSFVHRDRLTYTTQEQAKLAAFDLITRREARNAQE